MPNDAVYEMIVEEINTGNYNLEDMILKIDRIWLEGAIDTTQREELKALAREHAVPEDSYATPLQRILDLELSMKSLEARVKALEDGDTPTPDPDPEIPEWVQPTGAYNAYNTGDKVRYKGHIYESIIDGNVWAPDVYPAGWREFVG